MGTKMIDLKLHFILTIIIPFQSNVYFKYYYEVHGINEQNISCHIFSIQTHTYHHSLYKVCEI